MKYGIYSIRDAAAHVFTAPTIDLTDESAIRGFSQAVNNAGSVMNSVLPILVCIVLELSMLKLVPLSRFPPRLCLSLVTVWLRW